jgi:hypothetical protein
MPDELPRSPPVVVEDAYTTWLWLDERVAQFPTLARRTLGQRLASAALDALVCTVEASMTRGAPRLDCLVAANRSLTVTRLLLRAARDRRLLGVSQHEHAMRRIDVWGRQLGGWLRAERAR